MRPPDPAARAGVSPGPSPPPPLLRTALAAWHADPAGPTLAWAGGPPCPAPDLAGALASFAGLLAGAGVEVGVAEGVGLSPPLSRPPPLVGLYLGPGPAWVAAALGCWAAGCAFASLDPRWPPAVGAAALGHLPLAAVVWAEEDGGSGRTPGGAGPPAWASGSHTPLPPLIRLPPGFPAASLQPHPPLSPPPPWWPAHALPAPFCYALPTSGTSASADLTPRFVLGTPAGVAARLAWATAGLGLGRADTVACLTRPTAVDAVGAALLPLLAGAAVVCGDPGDPVSVAGAVAGATMLTATPAAWGGLLAAGGGGAALARLRLAISSGEPLPRRLAAAIADALPASATFLNVYGLTEAAGDSTAGDVRAWLLGVREEKRGDTAPAGFPIAGAAVWATADPADPSLPPAGAGEEGVVVISGPGLAAGYSPGASEPPSSALATATRFVTAVDGTRALLTGDRGVIDPATGALHLRGRIDRVVKGGGGGRVDLDALEAAVAASCPGVAAAAAVTLPGAAAPGLAVVAATTTTAGGGAAPLTPASVRAWAAASLPPAAHPGAVVLLPALPLLAPGGKVDRRAVVAALVAVEKGTAPTPGEAAVAMAMAVALARRRAVGGEATVGGLEATTDFVAGGGDSLDAAAVAAALGGGATAALILAGRTPRGVARLLAGGGGVPEPASVPALPLLDPSSPLPSGGWRAVWRVPLRGCVDAPPTILGDQGCVLATSHAGDAVCVAAASGRVVWRAELGAAADEGGTAGHGCVAVALAALPAGGGGDGGLAILDAGTGAFACPLIALGGSPRGPPTADEAGWWVGTREGEVVSVGSRGPVTARLEAGTRLVGAPTGPAGPGGAAFLVGTGPAGASLLRLAPGAGSAAPASLGAWAPDAPAPASAPPLVLAPECLVVIVDTAGCAAAFDMDSGALAWRAALGGPVAAAPLAVGRPTRLVFPLRSGPAALVAVDARSGARLWEAALPGDGHGTGAASTPAALLVSGRSDVVVVAIAADNGSVAAFAASSGALLAAARLPGAAYGGPVSVGPTLIACGCRDDAVWGLELLCVED
jgi:acyl-CoA synthetase (AMP-forming)/AMP-acid ligase II/outer membrane protein assembly factor BamB